MVMAVSFERYGRLYYLDAGDLTVRVGDKVLVPTDDGTEVAECVWAPQYVDDEIGGLPRLGGPAARAAAAACRGGRVWRPKPTWRATRPTAGAGPRHGWPPRSWSSSTSCR